MHHHYVPYIQNSSCVYFSNSRCSSTVNIHYINVFFISFIILHTYQENFSTKPVVSRSWSTRAPARLTVSLAFIFWIHVLNLILADGNEEVKRVLREGSVLTRLETDRDSGSV